MKSPLELGLPFAEWRPGQRLAIRTCLAPKTTHIVLNAPTGSGKSTIAAALSRLRPDKRHVILTSTKGLQSQYNETFSHLSDLRGLSNYECLAARDEFKDWFGVRRRHVTCDDGPCREGAHCGLRDDGCLYFDRRRQFLASNAGITNYAAWLSNRRYGEGLGQADVLVLDEAHNLPDELMSAARIDIPSHILNSRPPKTWRDWRRWASDKLTSLPKADEEDTRAGKARLEDSLRKLSGINETWAWDYTIDNFTFEPTIPKLLLPTLHTFDGECTIIYLSATITPATLIMLDVDKKDVTFETMESRFPLPMRPVYIRGRTRVDYRSMQIPAQHQAWIDEIDDIIGERLDRNGLIHTVSFDRGYDILKHSRYKRYMLMHHRGQNVGDVITDFRAQGKHASPVILLSPSITTGYDFPYCVAPETRVLTSDLKWQAAGEVREGDSLGAFDEYCADRGERQRRWRKARVTKSKMIRRPCYEIELADGTKLVCSEDHKWLVKHRGGHGLGTFHGGDLAWVETQNLRADAKLPSHLSRVCDTWDTQRDWDAGFLAAAFNAEGHLYQGGRQANGRFPNTCSFSQVDNVFLDELESVLGRSGYKFTRYSKGAREIGHQDGFSVRINDRWDLMKFLGSIRPSRLLPKFSFDSFGALRVKDAPAVVSKRYIGSQWVSAFSTTTRTFVAEGFATHNTQAEYQIIAKLPFPDTRSRIMKARCDNTSEYAQWATMTRLVQAAGRINRSAEDRGETFIVDGHARWFLDQYPYLAPKWFLDAIVTTRRVTKPLPKLRGVA